MPRYKLTIAYDGTNFCGWQKQEPLLGTPALAEADAACSPSTKALPPVPAEKIADHLDRREGEAGHRVALRTVQHVVEQAVRVVTRERVTLDGASRTDSGVHARGQVAAFTCGGEDAIAHASSDAAPAVAEPSHTGWPLSRGVDRLVRAINGKLPEDVVVLGAEVVPHDFNPVRHATSKAYSYTIHNARERAMWDRNYVHHVYEPLDIDAMQHAAASIVGTHDFVAFAAANHGRLTTVRTVFACSVSATPNEPHAQAWGMPQRVRIDITGSGFLYNMVRIISGTLVEVGRGRMKPDAIPTIIAGKDRRAAGPTLPGRGLCLEWIRYDREHGGDP